MASRATIDSFLETIRGDADEGIEKTAYSRSDVTDTANAELLNKLAEDMDADEVLKQAAAARVSGNIMAEIILEKVASQLAPSMNAALQEKIASLLPRVVESVVPAAVELVLQKLAVGTSTAISGNLTKSVQNEGSADEVREEMDRVGKNMKDRTAKYWSAEETSGATVSGGGASALEGGAGEKPEAWEPVHKLSSDAKVAQFLKKAELDKEAYLNSLASDPSVTLAQFKEGQAKANAWMKEAEAKAESFLKEAELEAELARYQELEQKKQAGALTPEEEQELQMLEQKLMAAAQAAQGGAPGGGAPGGGAPGGAPGEAGPPGGGAPGGMTVQASQKKASVEQVKELLKKHNLIG